MWRPIKLCRAAFAFFLEKKFFCPKPFLEKKFSTCGLFYFACAKAKSNTYRISVQAAIKTVAAAWHAVAGAGLTDPACPGGNVGHRGRHAISGKTPQRGDFPLFWSEP